PVCAPALERGERRLERFAVAVDVRYYAVESHRRSTAVRRGSFDLNVLHSTAKNGSGSLHAKRWHTRGPPAREATQPHNPSRPRLSTSSSCASSRKVLVPVRAG